MIPVNSEFAGGLVLAEQATQPQVITPGGLLAVHLRWGGAVRALAGSEKVTVQLLDAAGALVAQTDQALEAAQIGAAVTTYGILLPQELAPGTYRLIVAVYDPAIAGAPRLRVDDGGDFVDLGTVTVI
jgi:hypothetical protein